MAGCEICGKDVPSLTEITIDSAQFRVCDACRSLGPTVQRAVAAVVKAKTIPPAYRTNAGPEYELDANFAQKIRDARAKYNLSQEDLARLLAEKASVIHRLETGKLVPDLSLARKMERFLSIKLVEFEA